MREQRTEKGRATVYVRVSTEDQTRGLSLEAQEEICRERAASDGCEVVRPYVDAGVSGANSDRPHYQAMLADAAAGDFDALYVWKLDRLGRDAEELLRARRMLEAADVRLVSATEGEAESTLVYGVRALVAQEEREKISERTRMGLTAVARSGRSSGGQPPLGYRAVGAKTKTEDTRGWEINESEATIVRRIVAAYLAGSGTNTIAADLNADGVRTRRGAKFSPRVILDVLDNPAYVGKIRLKREEFDGKHEAILDHETWARLRTLRDARREADGRGRGRNPKGSHLFTKGLLRCGLCRGAMSPRTNTNGWTYYKCVRRHTYGDCPMPTVSRRAVDEQVLSHFLEVMHDTEATLSALSVEGRRHADEARALAERSEIQALALVAQAERVETDYLAGKHSVERYDRLSTRVERERQAAEAEAERLRAQAEKLAAEVEALDTDGDLRRHLADLRLGVAGQIHSAGDVQALRAALRATFERVVLSRDSQTGNALLLPILREEAVLLNYDGREFPWEEPLVTAQPIGLAFQEEREGEQSELEVAWPPGRRGRRDRRS